MLPHPWRLRPCRRPHGVQLVDEQDHLAFLLGQDRWHPLSRSSELAAELGRLRSARHVERQDGLLLRLSGTSPLTIALRPALDDRRLADARLADQHRVVLGTPLQHLDGAADLIVAAYHRVGLPERTRCIDGVLLERLAASPLASDTSRRRATSSMASPRHAHHARLLNRRASARSSNPPARTASLDIELVAALLVKLVG